MPLAFLYKLCARRLTNNFAASARKIHINFPLGIIPSSKYCRTSECVAPVIFTSQVIVTCGGIVLCFINESKKSRLRGIFITIARTPLWGVRDS